MKPKHLALTALLLLVGSAFAPAGCAIEGTGGDLVPVELAFVGGRATGDGPLGVSETLYSPAWQIELDEALLSVGAAYVFPPEPTAFALPFVSSALAHAGDDNLYAVNALAEYREPVIVDALSTEPQVVGPVLAEAGSMAEVSVWIDAPRDADGPTRGHHGWVRGTARMGDTELRFEAGIELENTPLSQRVDNIDAPGELVEGSRVVIEVAAEEWLRQVDFDALLADGRLEPDTDGVTRPLAPHPLQSAWLINFHDPEAFGAHVEAGSGVAP